MHKLMEALRLELERKRKEREALAPAEAEGGKKKKWVRRGDVEAAREAAYREAEAREAEERARRLVVPCLRKFDGGGEAASAGSGAAVSVDAAGPSGGVQEGGGAAALADGGVGAVGRAAPAESWLPPTEVKRLLRKLGQPIALFGEEDGARLERYRAVAAALPAEDEDDELKRGQMFNERQLFDETGRALQAGDHAEGKAAGGDVAGEEEDEYGGEEMAVAFTPTTPEQIVSRHFKQLVKLWEAELAGRDEASMRSAAARREAATFQQCRRHMKPFFRQLKARTMPLEILSTMTDITQHMSTRNYVKAHDAYILCAIGNAPWPMGITGTGVHERQGRQHIRESKVAHVMNDETQRKYLQSVKRLMTFAQRALPPTGPSMMVS